MFYTSPTMMTLQLIDLLELRYRLVYYEGIYPIYIEIIDNDAFLNF